MGLLDAIFPQDDASGLLGFLKGNAAFQRPNDSGLPSDQAQYDGQPQYAPGPLNAMAQAPAPQPMPVAPQPPVPQNPPPVIQAQPMQQPVASQPSLTPTPPGAGGTPGFMTGYQNFHNGGGLIGSIAAGITGQRNDPQGVALQQQAQVANVTAKALIAHGYTPQDAMALVQPGNTAALTDALKQIQTQGQYTQETDKDGNVWNVNKQTGQKVIALQAKDDKFSNVEVKNADGSTSIRTLNTKTGEYGTPQGAPSSAGQILGDETKTGADYIASLPADKRDTVKGMIDGTIQPPTSFAAAKPYWQQMIAAAKHAEPTWDENNWASRHKMSVDLASSGNSSMGGILSNGESSFKHLAEYTKSVADQGNMSHNFPLGGVLAHGQNYVGNKLGGSDTQGKVKAVNDNLGHYGQESTKFYAGTGGGVEERMNALHEMDANTTSGEESAAYAEKEKGLMLDRLNTKLRQIKDTFGEEQGSRIIAKHMPEIQANLKTINDNIDKLRGIKPGSPGSSSFGSGADVAAAPSASGGLPAGWSVKVR